MRFYPKLFTSRWCSLRDKDDSFVTLNATVLDDNDNDDGDDENGHEKDVKI